METIQQLEAWRAQIADHPHATYADIDVAKRLVNHGIRALGEIAKARQTSEYWKSEHLAGNAEIERLREALRETQ